MGLRSRLGRARDAWSTHLAPVRNSSSIDDSTWEGLADALLLADVGVVTTDALVDGLRKQVGREGVADADGLLRLLKVEFLARLGGLAVCRRERCRQDDDHRQAGPQGVGRRSPGGVRRRRYVPGRGG